MKKMVKYGGALFAAMTWLAAPAAAHGGVGQCYFRADTGYSWPTNDDATAIQYFVHGPVTQTSLEGTWFVEAGVGCSWLRQTAGASLKDETVVVTSSGLRAEIAVGYRGKRDFHGMPPNPAIPEDPVSARVGTATLMGNLYYDFARIRNITPYIGGGIGAAFHDLDQATFRDANVTFLAAHRQTDFAWQLMAGFSADIGNRFLLDIGYRYVDLGSVSWSAPTIGHALNIEDLAAHEVRVGLRVPLGRH